LSDGAHMGGGLNGQDAYTGRVLPVAYSIMPMKARDYKDATDLVSQAYSIMPMNSGKDYKARETEVAQPLMAGGPVGGNQGGDYVAQSAVRRLTPRECERLQGFPDDFTQIPYRNKPADQCPDGPRYKALGNSMAVPVMRWIGTRINIVEQITGDNNGR
jgi:site-specific DNA-cytosine methylase